jgi:hypothetical protein
MPSSTHTWSQRARLSFHELRGEHGDVRHAWQAALLVAAAGWLPLGITAVVERLVGGRAEPLVRDLAVHVRGLIAAPASVVAAWLLDRQVRMALKRLEEEGFAAPDLVERLKRRVEHWSRTDVLDLVFVIAALVLGQLMFWRVIPVSGAFSGRGSLERGPAFFFYAWLTFPLFAVLAVRFLVRWGVWAGLLFSLSRRPLAIDAAHPDRAGGIAFLALPTDSFAIFAFGTVAVASAGWSTQILAGRASVTSVVQPAGALLLVVLALAFLPLVWFSGALLREGRRGLRDYDRLAITYVRRFRERWIAKPIDPDFLGTSDIQSLSDMMNSFSIVEKMRLFPFGLRQLIEILIATLAPLAPLILTEVPLRKLLSDAAHLVTS